MNDETRQAIAAELRAQAKAIFEPEQGQATMRITGLAAAADRLRARADELDPPAASGTESVQPAGRS